MENHGYSNSNNELNQGAENNLYPNESKQERQQTKGVFMTGLLTGIIICSLLTSAVYVGIKVADIFHGKRTAETSASHVGDSVVNDDSIVKLESLEKVIHEYYYNEDDINTDDMMEGMYSGLVASLGDPYSVYYTEEEWSEQMRDTEGIYYGIGATISLDEKTGCGKIVSVMDDTPAKEAGLRDNDIIYSVDGESVKGLPLSRIVSKIKGAEGTVVHLTIYRESLGDYIDIDVTRGHRIESKTIEYEILDNGIAYIQITEFDEVTYDQFIEAMTAIKGQSTKGLILDLRGNPGGGLTVVVDIARQILPEGIIVYTEDRDGKRTEYSCDGKNELQIPLVVLVNGASASASEVLAGAIKDYGKGTLIGTTTFGKGIVQRILPLTDGTALKLTVSAYYTPNGNNIHNIGIEPDIECALDTDAYYDEGIDTQFERAVEELNKMIAK